MSLIDDNGNPARLLKYLADSIPLGPHPNPNLEWVNVRLDVVQTAYDHIDWLEKGVEEWRDQAIIEGKQAEASRASARIAIGHLHAVLNDAKTHAQQQAADTAARDWLASIGE